MTDVNATADESSDDTSTTSAATDAADRTEQLRSVYLAVTDGDDDPVVEPQKADSRSREIVGERADGAVGPAELHGLDDAIGDPDPSNA
ncbi:hypothetical protein [Natronorubrum halophilum]|uniref:hypothetical protein n=1 Tax=Natronorubrum halophilum TaxID=1702106 RepID=UPI0010C1F2D5|nr:hypothetical protein [Natronorubrum halophilum]